MNDDREVWKQISQGNVAAFDMLYRENAPRLCAFLRQITGDMQAAEDIVQETFAHVWKKPAGFKPESGNLRGWLFGICRKRAAEWWRKRAPVVREPVAQLHRNGGGNAARSKPPFGEGNRSAGC